MSSAPGMVSLILGVISAIRKGQPELAARRAREAAERKALMMAARKRLRENSKSLEDNEPD